MHSLETCVVTGCGALIDIEYADDGALSKVDVHGYSGLTDDGDPICRDHWCATCGYFHTDVGQFDACQFTGPETPNMTIPTPCGVTDPIALLNHMATAPRREVAPLIVIGESR